MNSMEMLRHKATQGKHVCVGLDPVWEKMPKSITEGDWGRGPKIKNFLIQIADSTKDVAAAYKTNLAFYLAEGLQGLWALQEVVSHVKCTSPDISVILDGKFGDIGFTCEQYAKFAFDVLGVDAVTVNPWGGKEDGLDAFFKREDKTIFVWCKGSNAGSEDLQSLYLPGGIRYRGRTDISMNSLYDFVARRVGSTKSYPKDGWNENGNCGVVAGADFEGYTIEIIRGSVGNMPMLVPGIGAQGGDLQRTVKQAIYEDLQTGEKSFPTIINSSRSILYASSGKDFAQASRDATLVLNSNILKILEKEMAV